MKRIYQVELIPDSERFKWLDRWQRLFQNDPSLNGAINIERREVKFDRIELNETIVVKFPLEVDARSPERWAAGLEIAKVISNIKLTEHSVRWYMSRLRCPHRENLSFVYLGFDLCELPDYTTDSQASQMLTDKVEEINKRAK